MRLLSAIFALAALFSLSACSTFDKKPKVIITVHSQGSELDPPKTFFTRQIGGRPVTFKLIPEFSQESVSAFHPFPADDGTFGAALKLDFKGANALDIATRMHKGEILMSMINGITVDTVVIDQPVTDGIFTIWKGFTEEMIEEMDKTYPRIKDLKSSSELIDMTPSTRKEKKQSFKRAAKENKEAAEKEKQAAKKRARGEFEPEAPTGELVPLDKLLKN